MLPTLRLSISQKRIIVIGTLCALSMGNVSSALAQKIYGIDSRFGAGNFFSEDVGKNNYTEFKFPGIDQVTFENPSIGRILRMSNGKVYGISTNGGKFLNGFLFELEPSNNQIKVLRDINFYGDGFYGDAGRHLSNLVEYNGKLLYTKYGLGNYLMSYDPTEDIFEVVTSTPLPSSDFLVAGDNVIGFTKSGGGEWVGSIYEIDLNTHEYKFLYGFESKTKRTGKFPIGRPAFMNGKVYGVTGEGGEYNGGTLFVYDIENQEFTKLYDFAKDAIGKNPAVDLEIRGSLLIGKTSNGGSKNKGTIFSYDITTNVITKLSDLVGRDATQTIRNYNGILYSYSGNDIYTIDPVNGTTQVKYTFNNDNKTGIEPTGTLTFSSDNEIWGVTLAGGDYNNGVLYSYNIATDQYTKHADLNNFYYGYNPTAIVDHENRIYGVTAQGGEFNKGTIFSFDPLTNQMELEFSFPKEIPYWQFRNYTNVTIRVDEEDVAYGYVGNVLYDFNLVTKEFRKLYTLEVGSNINLGFSAIHKLGDFLFVQTNDGIKRESFSYQISTQQVNILNDNSDAERIIAGSVTYNQEIYVLSSKVNTIYINKFEQNTSTLTRLKTIPISGDVSFSNGKVGKLAFHVDGNIPKFYIYDVASGMLQEKEGRLSGDIFFTGKDFYSQLNGNFDYFDFENGVIQQLPHMRIGENLILDYVVFPNPVECTSPGNISVVNFQQGLRQDGNVIEFKRSNPVNVLNYTPDEALSKFVALGFGGTITLAFDNKFCDREGHDFIVVETSHGAPVFADYPEQAEVWVSQDAQQWRYIGKTNEFNCNETIDASFDIARSNFDWIQYIQLKDITDPWATRRNKITCEPTNILVFNSAADGFDLDAILLVEESENTLARKSTSSVGIYLQGDAITARVYPNPVISDHLTINLDEEVEMVMVDGFVTLEIVDMMGKVWSSEKITVGGDWKIEKHVPSLRSGMYVARITSGNVNRMYKFIKN
jgi:uncharacterized repeat protein (TIGR03803 family)